MKKNSVIYGSICAFAVLLFAAYYYFSSPDSPSNFRIILPEEGQRVGTRLNPADYTAYTDLIIYYNGPDPEVMATIVQPGRSDQVCRLVSGMENTCYDLKLTVLGQNQFQIEYKPTVGEPVSKNLKVYWKPYNIFEIATAFVGGDNLKVGFLRIMFVVLFVSFALTFTKTTKAEDKLKNAFVVAWVVISITSFSLFSDGPGSTVLAFYGTILFWIAFSYFVFGKLVAPQKKINTPAAQPSAGTVMVSRVPGPNTSAIARLPKKTGDSPLSVIDGEIKE